MVTLKTTSAMVEESLLDSIPASMQRRGYDSSFSGRSGRATTVLIAGLFPTWVPMYVCMKAYSKQPFEEN